MLHRTCPAACAAFLFFACAAVFAGAQPPPGEPTPKTPTPRGTPSSLDGVPPSLRLGLRAAFVQSRMPTTPAVVVVPDERSFVAAVGSWDLHAGLRYPVLIDDGSWAARQAIARFVRAFRPKSVVRWSAPDDAPARPEGEDQKAQARRTLIEQAAARPWGVGVTEDPAPTGGQLRDALAKRWKELEFTPPGLVVAWPSDPAWPAALTLAAARGQPIVWLAGPGTIAGQTSLKEADAFSLGIESAAEASGRSWSALGDDLDAITICLNCSAKVFLGDPSRGGDQRAMLALTDLVGRRVRPETDKARKQRWAWAGMIFGNEWSSAYAAMCSVFLRPESAWLFDGYDDTPPWNAWDATAAGQAFEQAGLSVTIDDNIRRGVPDWRRRAAGRVPARSTDPLPPGPAGVWADIVCVNTSGNPDFFELKPGLAKPADVPILARPAMVHLVHSWSAAFPADPRTVGGRWIERGAYAYVGSVHEPYLQAFCPTPKLAQRLIVGLPWGVAPRIDDGEVWKVNIFGDPLITLGRTSGFAPGPRVDKPPPLPGALDVQAEMTAALKDRRYEGALVGLTLLARERDAARLIEAVLREGEEDKGAISPAAALFGLAACFFAGDFHTMAGLYAAALPGLTEERAIEQNRLWDARDMLWHAAFPSIPPSPPPPGTPGLPTTHLLALDRVLARLLAQSLRTENLQRDAEEAFAAARAAGASPEGAREVLTRAAALATSESERRKIEAIGR